MRNQPCSVTHGSSSFFLFFFFWPLLMVLLKSNKIWAGFSNLAIKYESITQWHFKPRNWICKDWMPNKVKAWTAKIIGNHKSPLFTILKSQKWKRQLNIQILNFHGNVNDLTCNKEFWPPMLFDDSGVFFIYIPESNTYKCHSMPEW